MSAECPICGGELEDAPALSAALADESVNALCRLHRVSTDDILGPSRILPLMKVRRAIATGLKEAGFNYHQIGAAMNREHSTIMNMLKSRGWA